MENNSKNIIIRNSYLAKNKSSFFNSTELMITLSTILPIVILFTGISRLPFSSGIVFIMVSAFLFLIETYFMLMCIDERHKEKTTAKLIKDPILYNTLLKEYIVPFIKEENKNNSKKITDFIKNNVNGFQKQSFKLYNKDNHNIIFYNLLIFRESTLNNITCDLNKKQFNLDSYYDLQKSINYLLDTDKNFNIENQLEVKQSIDYIEKNSKLLYKYQSKRTTDKDFTDKELEIIQLSGQMKKYLTNKILSYIDNQQLTIDNIMNSTSPTLTDMELDKNIAIGKEIIKMIN